MSYRRGYVPFLYAIPIVLVILVIATTIPVIPQQKITFSLNEGDISNPNYIKEGDSVIGIGLDSIGTQRVSNAKVELVAYNTSQRSCLNRAISGCRPVINKTKWLTPTTDVSLRINVPKGEYVSRITSFIYDENRNEMQEHDATEFSFAVGK